MACRDSVAEVKSALSVASAFEPISEAEDECEAEAGREWVKVPREAMHAQKRLFQHLCEMYRLVTFSEEVSLVQSAKDLVNSSLRAKNVDVAQDEETSPCASSPKYSHKSSPRSLLYHTPNKPKPLERRCALPQAIVTTLYNMIREKDQIEVVLEQSTGASEEAASESLKSANNAQEKQGRFTDCKVEEKSSISQRFSEPSLAAEVQTLRRESREKTKEIDRLSVRLVKLRKVVSGVCARLNALQEKNRSAKSCIQGVATVSRCEDTSTGVLDCTEVCKPLFDRLAPIDGSCSFETAVSSIEKGVTELQNAYKSVKSRWSSFISSSQSSADCIFQMPLLLDMNQFFTDMVSCFPLLQGIFDSAKKCHTLMQKLNRPSIPEEESRTDKLTFLNLARMLAEVERKLAIVTGERTAYFTPKHKKARTRVSMSSNDKLIKDEIESLERAKGEIHLQELLFENDQLKDSQQNDRTRITELQSKVATLEVENKAFKEKIAALEDVIQSLQEKLSKIKSIEESELKKTPDFTTSEVHFKLDELDQSIKDLLANMHNEKRESLLPKLHSILMRNVEYGLERSFSKWKNETFAISWNGEEDDPLRLWKQSILQKNELLSCFALDDSCLRTPMPAVIVIKTLDEVMLKRAERLGASKSFPSFAIDYLTEKLGSRASAIRTLKQAIPTLTNFEEEEYFGQFLARMMQVQNPFSDAVADFFVKVNWEMYELVRKRSEEKLDETERLSLDVEFVDPESGGKLFLSDALDLLYSLEIARDPDLCRKVINYLRGADIDKREYVLFVVSHKLQRDNVDPSELFGGCQSLKLPIFIPRLKSKLGLCLSEKKLLATFQSQQMKGAISLMDFRKAVSAQFYGLNAYNNLYAVDRFFFLYVLSFVYDYTVDRSVEVLKSLYESHAQEEHWQGCFAKALHSADPSISESDCDDLVTQAISAFKQEPLSDSHFLAYIAERGIAGYFLQPFSIKYSECAVLPEKRERRLSHYTQSSPSPERRLKHHTIVGVTIARRSQS